MEIETGLDLGKKAKQPSMQHWYFDRDRPNHYQTRETFRTQALRDYGQQAGRRVSDFPPNFTLGTRRGLYGKLTYIRMGPGPATIPEKQ